MKIIKVLFFALLASAFLIGCSSTPTPAPTPTASTINTTPDEFSFRAGASNMCLVYPKSTTDSNPLYSSQACITLVRDLMDKDTYQGYLKVAGKHTNSDAFYSGALNLCMNVGGNQIVCNDLVRQLRALKSFESFESELFK